VRVTFRYLRSVSSDLKSRLQSDLNDARKQRDKARTLVLSTALADVKNREIELGAALQDADLVQVLTKAIKQRKDAAEMMRAGGRPELADKEETEARVLASYLPEGMSEGEVRAIIREAVAGGANAVGPLMAVVMPRIRGRFDGKEANRIAREELGS
jgi:uncharacterized protein YqeY